MPLPLALAANVAMTAGGALVKAAPAIQKQFMTYVSKATGGRVSDISSAVSYASQSKNNLAVVAINAAKAGVRPEDLIPTKLIDDSRNVELANLANRVRNAFANAYGKIDAASSIVADGSQETVMLSMAVINKVSDLLGVRGDTALSSAHVQLRMWLAMSEQEHTQALQMRRVARG
jgi:hypothetical protein